MYFSQFWRLGSPMIKAPAFSVWLGPSCCIHSWRKGLDCSLQTFYKVLIQFVRAESSQPNHLLKVPPINTVALGIEFQHEFWRGHKYPDHGRCLFGIFKNFHFYYINFSMISMKEMIQVNSIYFPSPSRCHFLWEQKNDLVLCICPPALSSPFLCWVSNSGPCTC